MLRNLILRVAPAGLLAVALFQAAPGGSPVAATDDPSPDRRQEERAPAQVSEEMARARHAVYEHLRILGIPEDALREGLIRIDGLAQQGIVDSAELSSLAALAGDADSAAKARDILQGHAEFAAYGEPRTTDLLVNDYHRPMAGDPGAIGGGGGGAESEVFIPSEPDGPEGPSHPQPHIGGICSACGVFDYGPFSPTPVYQTHSSNALSGGADCAWYRFDVVAGNRYEFRTCPPGATSWDTVVEVFTSGCVLDSSNDNACPPNGGSVVFYDALANGHVFVRVRPYDLATAPGAYTLAYKSDPIVCDTCPSPNPVPLANPTGSFQCFNGSTNTTCRRDFWLVNLVACEDYVFTTCQNTAPGATANYDSLLRLWRLNTCGAGTQVALNDDGGCGLSPTPGFNRSTMTWTADITGTYVLEVTGRTVSGNPVVGNYTLCYRRTSAPAPTCSAGPFVTGLNTVPTPACQYSASSITACQGTWYDFQLTAGSTYEFATCPTLACPGAGSGVDTVLELFDATNCAGPAVAVADNECGLQSILTYSPGVSGNYRLRVRGNANATGPFTLSYREVGGGGCTAPNTVNISPAGGITDPGTCSRNETFSVSTNASATTPITYTWTITAPPGGTANFPNGAVVSAAPGGAAANFGSLLTREGTYRVCVTATNACGSHAACIDYVLVDGEDPQVTAPADQAAECDDVPAPDMVMASDNCDPSPDVDFSEVIIAGPCADTYDIERTWTATDRSGRSASDMQVITVSDTEAPMLLGTPVDVEVSCDAVPDPAPVTADDNCDPNPSLSYAEVQIAGACPGSYVLERTWTALDRCGNESSFTQVITVVDDEAPVVTPNTSQVGCIWPPNHKWACFDLASFGATATENCSEPITWQVTGVTSTSTSQDPCGDGNHDPDVIINPDGSVCIRAERCGQERGGRFYTVQATATDACGNVSSPTPIGTIYVPHDQRSHPSCTRPTLDLGN